jgi:hypothetical protein
MAARDVLFDTLLGEQADLARQVREAIRAHLPAYCAPVNVVISNVPGSPTPLFFAGAQLLAQYPVSLIMDGVALNLTAFSYRDAIDLCVVCDRDVAPDAWPLVEHVKAELAELRGLVGHKSQRRTSPATTDMQGVPQ